ncbi:MAG TPA: class I SAM-dependent methyltransferase [Syntrophobacteraceae bacterium]|nr:class I SAM-dependent methyltransferase [Syntrophobacteraceae bacterium]
MGALLRESGIRLPPRGLDQLWSYHQLLRQYNPDLNLSRISNFTNMVQKLYVDSILPGQILELPSPLLDLGTGPGMPGIPLKIAFPRLEILLAESRQGRAAFLERVLQELKLSGIEVVPMGIGPRYERPVKGVITRAVESVEETLRRVRGCLDQHGLVIFMKGPGCDAEVDTAVARFSREYRLVTDHAYGIAGTPHKRRLVVFQRLDEPERVRKVLAMEHRVVRTIESEGNREFKSLRKLLGSRGVKKEQRALVSGPRQVAEVIESHPQACDAWVSELEGPAPPSGVPRPVSWVRLSPELFRILDLFGTGSPLLVVKIPPIPPWEPSRGLPGGCSLLLPFQDPENVGSAVRSAAALGVSQIILLEECAHPFHPKAVRASGGTVFAVKFLRGPSLETLPDLPGVIPLDARGKNIEEIEFPPDFALLPGIEGPGLPGPWRSRSAAIPIRSGIDSLNAAAAVAIALYVWSRRKETN